MNIHNLYIEDSIKDHPRVKAIQARLPHIKHVIYCEHYGAIFNRKSQNFRLQKKAPALILAEKRGRRVLPTPEGFGIGGTQNYYFSHMLNCLYDCRYCFLQGMYNSAHYVLFVNYEDFIQDITQVITDAAQKPTYFFSGYDCDSLAMEPVSQFLQTFLPFFKQHPQAILELRTKSTNIRTLLKETAFNNCVVAFSFTPQAISQAVEHKVPSVAKRLTAMQTLAQHGWRIGLRFDPLIYSNDFAIQYQQLLDTIFQHIPTTCIHSVSLGPLRFPEKMLQKITKLYPKEPLFAHGLQKRGKIVSYRQELETEMKQFVLNYCQRYLDKTQIFECHNL